MHRAYHAPATDHKSAQHPGSSSSPTHVTHVSRTSTSSAFARWRQGTAWQATVLTLLVAQWYIFSYLFNASLKGWFGTHSGADTLFPLLFVIFLANAAATGLWTLHSYGWVGCDVLGGCSLTNLVFDNQTDFMLLCASGIVGVAATCVVLQFGSIQLVQV